MNNNNQVIPLTQALIQKDFALDFQGKELDETLLLDHLAEHILYLIEHNFEYLFSILYILDVDENKVHEVMQSNAAQPINLALARLVLERQKKKIITRLSYSVEQDIEDDVEGW